MTPTPTPKQNKWYMRFAEICNENSYFTPLWENVAGYFADGYAPGEVFTHLQQEGELVEISKLSGDEAEPEAPALVQVEAAEDAQAHELAVGIDEPEVDSDAIAAKITNRSFTLLPSGVTVVCEITMANGFIMRGESYMRAGQGQAEYDIAKRKAYNDAVKKIKPFESYLLREREYEARKAAPVARISLAERAKAVIQSTPPTPRLESTDDD